MDIERVQIHVETDSSFEQDNITPGTPIERLSLLSASTPEVWATPGQTSQSLYSFPQIISMPSLRMGEPLDTSGEMRGRNNSSGIREEKNPETLENFSTPEMNGSKINGSTDQVSMYEDSEELSRNGGLEEPGKSGCHEEPGKNADLEESGKNGHCEESGKGEGLEESERRRVVEASEKETIVSSKCDSSLMPTLDSSLCESPNPYVIAPPNTPQINIQDWSAEESIISPNTPGNVTVYEKTPCGDSKGHSHSLSEVKIVAAFEKRSNTVDVNEVESQRRLNDSSVKVIAEHMNENGFVRQVPDLVPNTNLEKAKSSSKTYLVPASEDGAKSVEDGVKSVSVVNVSAAPFTVQLVSLHPSDLGSSSVDEVSAEIIEMGSRGEAEIVVIESPGATSTEGRSSQQEISGGFRSESEMLVPPGHDCEELLGGCLVRPCPSMRPYRKKFAKGCVFGFFMFIVAFVIIMIMVTRV